MSRHIIIIHCTNLRTQSCPGYLRLILRLSALGHKLRFQLFFLIKVDPLNSASQTQAKNIPMVLPSSPKNYILSKQRKNVMMLYRNYSEVM